MTSCSPYVIRIIVKEKQVSDHEVSCVVGRLKIEKQLKIALYLFKIKFILSPQEERQEPRFKVSSGRQRDGIKD